MLALVVPLKSKRNSDNWEMVSQLCIRSLKSICSQDDEGFVVALVCNEVPDLSDLTTKEREKIDVLQLPFLHRESYRKSGTEVIKLDSYFENDKALKLRHGFEHVTTRYAASYLMSVDADDCVSSKLAGYVRTNKGAAGWYANSGYVYPEGGKIIFHKRKNFQQLCGTSIIIATEFRNRVFRNEDGLLIYNHWGMLTGDVEIIPLPFPAAVYSVKNGENCHMTAELQKKLLFNPKFLNPRSLLQRLSRYRFSRLRKSHFSIFGLYPVDS